MTIIETNKHLIFSGNELTAKTEKEVKWYIHYDGIERRVDETSSNHQNHRREVKTPYTQLGGNQHDLNYLCEVFGANADAIENEITIALMMPTNYTGKATNQWGEPKIECQGNPRDINSWYIWVEDTKVENDVRKGDTDTYGMTPELLGIARRIVEDTDDAYPLEAFNFNRGVPPSDLHEKPNLYLVCDKSYLKRKFDALGDLMALSTVEDGTEYIRMVDNWATVQQIVAQDNEGTPYSKQSS